MKLDLFHLDAFARRPFEGNPAAVCPLDEWLDDVVMQAIASENNLSETAFFVREGEGYRLRWFTPSVEVDLCGHATLASAWVLFHEMGERREMLRFFTRSGELRVSRADEGLAMDFPAKQSEPMADSEAVLAAVGVANADVRITDDILVAVDDEAIVAALKPDMHALKALPGRGVVVTAPGHEFDIVSRWFGPKAGVDEDPVTGSAHTSLAPYWSERLGKRRLSAQQGGLRKGELVCEEQGDRVILTGQVVPYLRGTITI